MNQTAAPFLKLPPIAMAASATTVAQAYNVKAAKGDFTRALCAWEELLGADAVKCGLAELAVFEGSTVGSRRDVPAVLYPADEAEVQGVVRIANQFRQPIYPVSTGRNWGYGDSSPVRDGCVVVNLSRMNRIIATSANRHYAVVTVQPGVTQQMLYDHLETHSLPFMVPTHGGGPDCSIIGNALERGYGITPLTNHFEAVTAIRAVLGEGSIHESFFERVGATSISDRRKSQVGLDVDGLFAQSNLGVVTQAKILLRRRPSYVAAVFLQIKSDDALATIAPCIEDILSEFSPKFVGSINLMNRLRVLAMVAPYPRDLVTHCSTLSEECIADLARQHGVPAWLGAATLYGESRAAVRRTFHAIKRRLHRTGVKATFCDRTTIRHVNSLSRLLFGSTGERLRSKAQSVTELLDIAEGKPRRIALALTAWGSGEAPAATVTDPARQGSGIIWYSPYVPINAKDISRYRELVEATCREHGIEPLITFTAVDDQTFDSTVPLLFDNSNPEARARAQDCYSALLRRGQELGFVPYRYGIDGMDFVASDDVTHSRLHRELRKAFDPLGIIAPGRYH